MKPNTKNKLSAADILIWASVIVSAPRWAGAFILADAMAIPEWLDSFLQIANMIGGMAMGIIEVLGIVYLADAWGKIKPRKSWNAKHLDHQWVKLTGFIVGLFALMTIILPPYIVARMNGATIPETLTGTWQYIWSIAIVLSPAFVVGGATVARGTASNESRAQINRKPAARAPKENRKSAERKPQDLTTRQKILRAYSENPKLTKTAVAKMSGVSRQRVGQLVAEMTTAGIVESNGDGIIAKPKKHGS